MEEVWSSIDEFIASGRDSSLVELYYTAVDKYQKGIVNMVYDYLSSLTLPKRAAVYRELWGKDDAERFWYEFIVVKR